MDQRVSHSLGLVGLVAAVVMAWELHYVPLTRVFFQKRQELANLQQQIGQNFTNRKQHAGGHRMLVHGILMVGSRAQ